MTKKVLLAALAVLLSAGFCFAQNPVIRDQFSADPTARVFEGKVFLYPSHDINPPVPQPREEWFCMQDYHVFSSEDLVNWTDHGVLIDQKDVPWGNPEAYSMWAPDCVYKNGKYYFFFPNAPKEGFGFAIGIATAEHPEGPFTPEEKAIEGVFGIDPCCLIDSKGDAYLYWSGMGLRVSKLSDDLLSLEGESVRLDEPLPAGFKEGPFAFERNGKYYLTYPWVEDKTETLAYAMSDSPMGPFEYKGLIMEQSPTGCWTNHHSLVEYQGEWYLFYHHNDYSPNMDKRRSVRIDKVYFNEDGTIQQVTPTLRGVGIVKSNALIQIDRYSTIGGAKCDFVNPENTFEGWYASFAGQGESISFNDVKFVRKNSRLVARVRSEQGAKFIVKIGKKTVKLNVPATDGWAEVKVPTRRWLRGLKNISITLEEGSADIDWITFTGRK